MDAFASELLLAEDGFCRQYLQPDSISELLERHRQRAFDHTRQIFCLLSVELWGRRYVGA